MYAVSVERKTNNLDFQDIVDVIYHRSSSPPYEISYQIKAVEK